MILRSFLGVSPWYGENRSGMDSTYHGNAEGKKQEKKVLQDAQTAKNVTASRLRAHS